jgi:L-asparagine transporter-like permease
MNKAEIFSISEEELTNVKKKLKKRKIINAALIGFIAGIFFMGAAAIVKAQNPLLIIPMFIPIFLIYKLVGNSKKDKDLEITIKERNLNA